MPRLNVERPASIMTTSKQNVQSRAKRLFDNSSRDGFSCLFLELAAFRLCLLAAERLGFVVSFAVFEHSYYILLTISRLMAKELDHEKSYRTRIYHP